MIQLRVTPAFQVIDEVESGIDSIINDLTWALKRNLKTNTPKDTGRASRGWSKQKNTVSNKVPYIERLDKGWSSQKPQGFVKQTINQTIRQSKRRNK